MASHRPKILKQTERPLSSLSKGLTLLLKLRELSQPLGLSEASRVLGFNKATTFRILVTLERYGFIEKNYQQKNYKIGVNSFYVGSGYINGTKRAKVLEVMRKVASERGHAVTVAVLDGTSVLFIERLDSVGRLRVAVEVGERVPAYASGSGKVLLARYSDDEIKKKFRNEKPTALTKNTISSLAKLLSELSMVRARGFATNNEESIKGLCGIAVPVKNSKGWWVAALSGSYLAGSLNKKEQNDLLEKLLAGAAEIEKIGFDEVDTNLKFASRRSLAQPA
jgi:IclR family pca regulon transcriptional regulator